MRRSKAITTGAPATSIMKMVRFDHSISPRERSKMRSPEAMKPGAAGIARTGWASGIIGKHLNNQRYSLAKCKQEEGRKERKYFLLPLLSFSCLFLAGEG